MALHKWHADFGDILRTILKLFSKVSWMQTAIFKLSSKYEWVNPFTAHSVQKLPD